MNFKQAMDIWAHMCDYTCSCDLCDLKEFCHKEPCTIGEMDAKVMEVILETHHREYLETKYKKYLSASSDETITK